MKYFVVMEDLAGARIYAEGTHDECTDILRGIYNEIAEFRATKPSEEWTPMLYIEEAEMLMIGGWCLKLYTVCSEVSMQQMQHRLNNCKGYRY